MSAVAVSEFIYRIVPSRPDMLQTGLTEDEQRLVGEHFHYLQQLSKRIMLLAGRTTNSDESTFGIAIFTASDEDTAREIMMNDPAIKHGVFKPELFPFRISPGALVQQKE